MARRVPCPVCGKRLFDLISQEVELEIACKVCKSKIYVWARNGEVRTLKI